MSIRNKMDFSGNEINMISTINYYHQNIHDYNENMRRYLQILGDVYQNNYTNNENNRRSQTNNFNPYIYRGLYYPRNDYYDNRVASNNILNTLFRTVLRTNDNREYEDVVVRPSNEQIANATELCTFSEQDRYNNTNCPITLELFENGEQVCRIKQCSHIFKPRAIQDWFLRNVRCPVCRYDIRDYVEPERTEDEMQNDALDELVQELIDESPVNARTTPSMRTFPNPRSSVTRTLTTAIQSFINNELQNLPEHISSAAELLYTFDIPLNIDISYNTR
jgi:hypothetical protein